MEPGWTVVDGKKESAAQLPRRMQTGDPIKCLDAWVDSKKTAPPARFTKASLLEAMGKIHTFVQNDAYKKKLKETSGLGTEATRTQIIEGLVKRNLLKTSGKHVISSDSGRALVNSIPESLRDPGMTALWEDALELVAKGQMSEDDFLARQAKAVTSLVNKVSGSDFGAFQGIPESGSKKSSGKSGKKAGSGTKKTSQPKSGADNGKDAEVCPECKEKSLARRKSKKGSWYWGCFNKGKHSDGGPVFRPDNKGKPGERK